MQKMTQNVLTVAIPTYNRAELLKATLENLISQVKKDNLENVVNFFVSDNASEDNTQEVVAKLSAQHPNLINYNRNPKNVVWENMRIVAEMATGRYVWLCSDDEKYSDGVVKHIVDVATKDIYKFIYLNIDQNFDNNYIKICNIDEDLECNPPELISRTGVSLTTLSCCVLRKDVIENIPTNFVTWYHFEKAFNLKENDRCYIIAEPYLHYVIVSSWNIKEKRVKYYTELFSLIMLSAQEKAVKNAFLKSQYLRSIYIADIIDLIKEKSDAVDLKALGRMLDENCKKSKCRYFNAEKSLLKHDFLWYFYYKKYQIQKFFRELKNHAGNKRKRANSEG